MTDDNDPLEALLGLPVDDTPFSETEQGRREAWIDEGFTGSFADLVEWMGRALMNGSVELASTPVPDPLTGRRHVRRLNLVSGGYSTAELAMERLRSGLLGFYWESSHRGGLDVYLVPEDLVASDEERGWVLAASDLVLSASRARRVVLADPGAMFAETVHEAPAGAEVLYREDPDTGEGVLTVRVAAAPDDEKRGSARV